MKITEKEVLVHQKKMSKYKIIITPDQFHSNYFFNSSYSINNALYFLKLISLILLSHYLDRIHFISFHFTSFHFISFHFILFHTY